LISLNYMVNRLFSSCYLVCFGVPVYCCGSI